MRTNKNTDADLNFRRAIINLYRNFHTVNDLLTYWSFAGPCTEEHPSVEDV